MTYNIANRKLIIFLISIIISTVIINVIINIGINVEYLRISSISIFSKSEPKYNNAIILVGLKRLKQLAIIIVLAQIVNIDNLLLGIIIAIGSVFGFVLSVQAYYVGIAGVLIGLIYLLPQFIIYFIGIYFYYLSKNGNQLTKRIKFANLSSSMIIMVVFSIVLIGIFVETYFSKFFFNVIHQYIVLR